MLDQREITLLEIIWKKLLNYYSGKPLSSWNYTWLEHSLCANPLAQSPRQVKLDWDKWKLWKNLLE